MGAEMIYVLMRQGYYQQGIFGVFLDLESAIQAGTEAIKAEHDAYHSFYIHELEVSKLQPDRDGRHVRTISKNPFHEVYVIDPATEEAA